KDTGGLEAGLVRQRWVRWVGVPHQEAIRHTGGNTYALRSGHFRHGHRRGTDDAAADAAQLSTRHTARYATHYAARCHDRRRSFLFFDHLHFLRNLGGRSQLTVDDIGLNLFHDLDRGGCWRWRWRWRRRRHQECHELSSRQGFGKDQRDQNHNADDPNLNDERDQRGHAPLGL